MKKLSRGMITWLLTLSMLAGVVVTDSVTTYAANESGQEFVVLEEGSGSTETGTEGENGTGTQTETGTGAEGESGNLTGGPVDTGDITGGTSGTETGTGTEIGTGTETGTGTGTGTETGTNTGAGDTVIQDDTAATKDEGLVMDNYALGEDDLAVLSNEANGTDNGEGSNSSGSITVDTVCLPPNGPYDIITWQTTIFVPAGIHNIFHRNIISIGEVKNGLLPMKNYPDRDSCVLSLTFNGQPCDLSQYGELSGGSAAGFNYDLNTDYRNWSIDQTYVVTYRTQLDKPQNGETYSMWGRFEERGTRTRGHFTYLDDAEGVDVYFDVQNTQKKSLKGATLQIVGYTDGAVAASWTSDGSAHKVTLAPGTYLYNETAPATGYACGATQRFTVKTDGTVVMDNATVTDNQIIKQDSLANWSIQIRKTDALNNLLPLRSLLKLTGTTETGESVNRSFPVEASTIKTLDNLQPGKYTITETDEPGSGYNKAADVTFTLDIYGQLWIGINRVSDIKMMNPKKAGVTIRVVDEAGNEISGVQLTLMKEKEDPEEGGSLYARWTTTSQPKAFDSIQDGTYYLNDVGRPTGYQQSTSIKFTVENNPSSGNSVVRDKDGNIVTQITMVERYVRHALPVLVQNEEGSALSGVRLHLEDEKGTRVGDAWTSGETAHTIGDLVPGTYTLVQESAPTGYELADDQTITINVTDGETLGQVTMTNPYIRYEVTVNKVDANGIRIGGASLLVTSESGYRQSWTSVAGNSYRVKVPFGTYTLTETQAPKNYEVADPIEFTVAENGSITVGNEVVYAIEMTDLKTGTVLVRKEDENGDTISGARLQIVDRTTGKVATDAETGEETSWTTRQGILKGYKLRAGSYTLKEIEAPKGYNKAADVNITVDKTGKVTWRRVTSSAEETGMISLVDTWQDQTIAITKVNADNEPVVGATLRIVDQNGKVIHPGWTTNTGVGTLKIHPGTYTLQETSVPSGYQKASDITFTVTAQGGIEIDGQAVTQTYTEDGKVYSLLEMVDVKVGKVMISKVNEAGEEIGGASLQIVNGDGNVVTDKSGSQLSWTTVAGKSKEIELNDGSYTLQETKAPDGYVEAMDIEFKVEDGNTTIAGSEAPVNTITMTDAYEEHPVVIAATDMSGAQRLAGADIVLYRWSEDGSATELDEWISEADTYTIRQLEPGTYSLLEIEPPAGYELVDEVFFKVGMDGKIQIVDESEVLGIAETDDADEEESENIIYLRHKKSPTPVTPESGDNGNGGSDSHDEHQGSSTPVTKVSKPVGGSSFAIVQTDSVTGLAVAGGVYELYDLAGNKIGSYTADSYGIVQVTNVAGGNASASDAADGGAASAPGVGGCMGDNSPMVLYGGIAAAAAAILAAWLVIRRRRRI